MRTWNLYDVITLCSLVMTTAMDTAIVCVESVCVSGHGAVTRVTAS
jgi:hypothetical protein